MGGFKSKQTAVLLFLSRCLYSDPGTFFIPCLCSLFSYMELEAKLAHSKGLTLDAMVDNDDRQKQIEQSQGGWTSSVGDQTRAAAMASAGGQRR